MGLHTVFTTVGAPTVSLPVRWGNNRPGSSQRDTAGRETSLSSAIFICGSQLFLVPPACWNTLRLKIQLNVKQRKTCNYPFTDVLFQIFISEVSTCIFHDMQVLSPSASCRAVSVTLDKILFNFMWVITRCWDFFTHFTHAISYFESCTIVDLWM